MVFAQINFVNTVFPFVASSGRVSEFRVRKVLGIDPGKKSTRNVNYNLQLN